MDIQIFPLAFIISYPRYDDNDDDEKPLCPWTFVPKRPLTPYRTTSHVFPDEEKKHVTRKKDYPK